MNAWMCVSSRRRPITSPPGGGTVARPKRASSGPARRNEARISRPSSGSSAVLSTDEESTVTAFAPSAERSCTIVSTSRIRGTFDTTTGAVASTVAARIGSAPFLLPAARTVPDTGRPPSMTNDCMRGAIVPGSVEVTRDRAWETLTRYTTSESLLRHALAVEASVRGYARRLGEDEELWAAVALLHDFDYEIH